MRTAILFLALAMPALPVDLLVQGDPPLTSGIVQNVTGILEWVLGSPLPGDQRSAVQQTLVNTWHQHNMAQIAQYVQLSNLRAHLGELDSAQQQTLRTTLLAQLQGQANPTMSTVASSSGPVALTGKWEQRSGGSTVTYRDSVTGSYAAPSGNINRYAFTPDGQYEYAELHQVTNYNCTSKYFGYEKGPYTVNGNRITFTQRQHSLKFDASCSPSLNSDKNLPLKTETYFFEIVNGPNGQELQINDGKTRWRFVRAAD